MRRTLTPKDRLGAKARSIFFLTHRRLRRITFFAREHHIVLRMLAPAGNRGHVIHRHRLARNVGAAVKTMSITDGLSILRGGDNAATNFLKTKTTAELTTKFSPIVKNAINKVQLTKYWKPLINKYNMIPGVSKKNPDLDKYVTEKALEGLFKLLAQEEAKIRKDPMAQVTDLLRRVFGNK
jgi:hypothetical protein